MLEVWIYSFVSVIAVSLVSLVGIFFLSMKDKILKNLLIYMVSFAAGALFGDAFIHLLPEVVEEMGFTSSVSFYLLWGIIFFFLTEKVIRWRHCHIPPSREHTHPFAMLNLLGDTVHNFIDGLIIAGSYLADISLGIATTIAVILHEIPQEIGDFGVLLHGGFSRKKALAANFLTALAAVGGVLVTLLLSTYFRNPSPFLLPFAAGSFIYIAGTDLIPELHKEVGIRKSFLQLVSFICGIAVMVALLLLD